jgi:hypothetical protein
MLFNQTSKEDTKPMTYKYERKYPAQCPFLRATGLDLGEAWLLQVGDIIWRDGRLCVHIREYRSLDQVVITERIAPVVPGQVQAVLRLVEGRAPQEQVFSRPALPVPTRHVMYSLRRHYARALYLSYDPQRKLPGPAKREITSPREYDEEAARKIAAALGRPDTDPVVLMRWYVL